MQLHMHKDTLDMEQMFSDKQGAWISYLISQILSLYLKHDKGAFVESNLQNNTKVFNYVLPLFVGRSG